MMPQLTVFLWQSALCSGLLYGYYRLFLCNRRMHRFNRWYLVAIVPISLLVPLMPVPLPAINATDTGGAFRLMQIAGNAEGEEMFDAVQSAWGYRSVLPGIVYSVISALLLGRSIAGVAAVYRLKRRSAVLPMHGYDMVFTTMPQAPFSFFNTVFWREDIDPESNNGRRILQHELAHIRGRHTPDKLFMQAATALCWFNPFYWLIKKELSEVHEFIADDAAITDNDTDAFARMLLQTHYGHRFTGVVHPFFNSSIKRRTMMLNQIRKTKHTRLRALMVLPVLAGTVLLFSFKPTARVNVNRAEKRIVLALDAGHGGTDKGAVTADGIAEKDLNRTVTRRLAELADAYNITVIPTHADDEVVSLAQRTAIANRADADMLISIHVNGATSGGDSKSGYEMILDERSANAAHSRVLASAIAARIKSMNIESTLLQKHLAVLRNAEMPAILIECGYVNNAKDMALLQDNAKLDMLCNNILSGVVDYHKKK